MADDKSKRGPQDRALVDGGEDYEVGYLMKKHHLERADALRLVRSTETTAQRSKSNSLPERFDRVPCGTRLGARRYPPEYRATLA